MNIDKKALHEATVDTTLALPINWFLSFFVLQILSNIFLIPYLYIVLQ